MKKGIGGIAVLLGTLMCAATMPVTAHAADKVQIRVSTEKTVYEKGDSVGIDVHVTNGSRYEISDLKLNAELPAYLTVTENKSIKLDIAANDTKTYHITALPTEEKNNSENTNASAPNTGDTSGAQAAVAACIGSCALLVMLLSRKKQSRSLLTLLLCTSMTLSLVPTSEMTASAVNMETASVSASAEFTYGSEKAVATVSGTYSKPEDVVLIDTAPLGAYNTAVGVYAPEEKTETLSGTLAHSDECETLRYKIEDNHDNVLGEGTLPVAGTWTIEDFGLVAGLNIVTVTAEMKDGESYSDTAKICCFSADNADKLNVDLTDADGDKLPAYYESVFGTDPDKSDTDGDGLSDYDELTVYMTDPTKTDSDGNGTDDADEDADQDGLTLKKEIELGTNPYAEDTDKDGLSDGDEVNAGTDPLKADSDEDGLKDGAEVKAGLDPAKADSDGNGTPDGEEVTEQTASVQFTTGKKPAVRSASVTLNVPGLIEDHVTMRDMENYDVLSANVVGAVGSPVSITSDTAFDKAVITFEYDEKALGDTPAENLAVMWYDEENKNYVILDRDTVLDTDAHTVSYTTTHFSTYLVVDREIWYDCWREAMDYRSGDSSDLKPYDIGFCVDVSGSMYGDRIEKAKTALNTFIDAMLTQDKACLVSFESFATVESPYGTSKDMLRTAVNSLSDRGGTNTDAGLSATISELTANGRSDADKIIVMICDGDVYYVQDTINAAKNAGIAVYTINVVSGDNTLLQQIADETGGQYYYAATTEEVVKQVENIRGTTVGAVDITDADCDGLYDIYESTGVKIQNGMVLYSDPENPDTDGDGLTDYDELVGPPTASVYDFMNGSYSCVLCHADSDPSKTDSDGDTFNDNEDRCPYLAARHSIVSGEDKVEGNEKCGIYRKVDTVSTDFQFVQDYEAEEKSKSDSTYASRPDWTVEMQQYWDSCYDLVTIGALTLQLNAATALGWFLGNTGDTKKFNQISMYDFTTNNPDGIEHYVDQMQRLSEFAEDVLIRKPGESIKIGSDKPFTSALNTLTFPNWLATLGEASGAAAAEISTFYSDGDLYFQIASEYLVYDYYDWNINDQRELIWGFPNWKMAKLHYAGLARHYYQYGTYDYTSYWICRT